MAQDYQRCPGNSPFCLGMVEFNCCNSMETLENEGKGKCLSKHKRNNDQDINDFVEEAPKQKKLSLSEGKENDEDNDFVKEAPKQKRLSLSKGKGKALLPLDWFNATVRIWRRGYIVFKRMHTWQHYTKYTVGTSSF